MISDEFSGIDIDLLADYAGGALDGDDAARVARLVADDPAWREAYRMLSPGLEAVAADLRELGSAPEPMPADVVARLDAALAATGSTTPQQQPARAGERHLVAVPAKEHAPGSRARRRMRWAVPIAAAAGVIAFVGFGIDYLRTDSADSVANTAAAGSSAERGSPLSADDAAGLVPGLPDGVILASGTDYGPATLKVPAAPPAAAMAAKPTPSDQIRKGASLAPESRTGIAPDPGSAELQRLRLPDALLACLEAIAAEQGSGPITVQLVDYARYQGSPALIVQFSAGGATWSWAAGPDCGMSGSGAQRINSVKVG
jgi:hypothetical protein